MSDNDPLAAAVAAQDLPTTLRLLRAALGITSRGMCALLGVGQSRTLRRWEAGTWSPGQTHAPWPKLQRWAALVRSAADGVEDAQEVLAVTRERWGDRRRKTEAKAS